MSETDKDFIERLGNELRLPMYFGVDRSEHKRLVALTSRAVEKPSGADGRAIRKLLDELEGTLEHYHRNGPDYTHKDGTQVFDVSVLTDREDLINAARDSLSEPNTAAPPPITEVDEILRELVSANDAPRCMPPAPDSAYWERLEIIWDRARAYVSKGGA